MHARPRAALGIAAGALLAVAACSSGTTKADQVDSVASAAGLAPDVAAFVTKASTATDGTYVVTYTTTAADGSTQQVTVTQRAPDRRVDVYAANGTVESTIRTQGTTYQCSKDTGWTCAPLADQPGPASSGVLSSSVVSAALQQLTQRVADYDFALEDRTLVGVTAHCLVTTLKPGHDAPTLGASATLCLADSGAQLLVDVPKGKLEATSYSPTVADGAFTLPVTPTDSTASPASTASTASSSGG